MVDRAPGNGRHTTARFPVRLFHLSLIGTFNKQFNDCSMRSPLAMTSSQNGTLKLSLIQSRHSQTQSFLFLLEDFARISVRDYYKAYERKLSSFLGFKFFGLSITAIELSLRFIAQWSCILARFGCTEGTRIAGTTQPSDCRSLSRQVGPKPCPLNESGG